MSVSTDETDELRRTALPNPTSPPSTKQAVAEPSDNNPTPPQMANNSNTDQQQDSEPFPTIPSVAGPPPPIWTPAAPSAQVPGSSPPSQSQNGQYRVRRTPVAPAIRRPSVRLRRTSSGRVISSIAGTSTQLQAPSYVSSSSTPTQRSDEVEANRRRSSSEPQRPGWVVTPGAPLARSTTSGAQGTQLPCVVEEVSGHDVGTLATPQTAGTTNLAPPTPGPDSAMRRFSVGARSAWRRRSTIKQEDMEEMDPEIVDLLDVVDPEVATLSTLTNVQNSLFVPDLGPLLNRQPTYVLTKRPSLSKQGQSFKKPPQLPTTEEAPPDREDGAVQPPVSHIRTISSILSDSSYAVLPHGTSLDGWTEEEKAELDDHVRHMLHSKRSAFRRGLRGFGQYVRRPLGFFVTLYAVLITLFGAAWVLFLIGWINLGSRKLYIVNVVDNVLVALFAVMGDGLAPFRIWDTYNTIFIVHYYRLTEKIRNERQLPKLENKNDLPTQRRSSELVQQSNIDLEDLAALRAGREGIKDNNSEEDLEGVSKYGKGRPDEYTVLSPKQQASLELHQRRLARSHTFYKPHETYTHHAFPISFLIVIIVLCDMHSALQIALGTCTWSISYHVRPFALTTVILCCSICCNITAGIVIAIGDRKARKKDVMEKLFRQKLTQQAIKKIDKKKRTATQERDERGGSHGFRATSSSRTSMELLKKNGTRGSTDTSMVSLQKNISSQSSGLDKPVEQAPGIPELKVHSAS